MAIFIAFANQYVVKIQTTIAITAGSMLISALLVLFGKLDWFNLEPLAVETMESIDFQNFLLKGILGFLLFAGGLGINLKALLHIPADHEHRFRFNVNTISGPM
ncbi:hypothetical protein AL345_20805 [Aeromonas caviae]|nr:hypothetical protein AL345_20805 [Aeromonas caviae]